MNASRLAAWLLGAAVCGAWLASAAGISRYTPVARAPQVAPPDVELGKLAADVQAQAQRLRARLTNAPAPSPLDRNPFRFKSFDSPPRPTEPARVSAAALEPQLPMVPPEPLLRLIGMAEQKTAEGVNRTAMIADEHEQLIMAAVGSRILSRYEVVAIGADAIELRDLQTDAIRRLVLQEP